MYKYQSSLVLSTVGGSAWSSPNLENQTFAAIYATYAVAFITVTHPALPEAKHVNLIKLRNELGTFAGTVKQWLDSLGNRSLSFVDSLPDTSVLHANYADAVRSGFKIALANEGRYHAPGLDRSTYTDASMEREDTNMNFVESTCLVTVNGFVHDCSANDYTLYVRQAAVSADIADCFNIGLISFGNIGTLRRIRIDPNNVRSFERNGNLSEKILITVPDYEADKAFFLVLGGYLIFPKEGVFYQVGINEFALDLNRIDLFEKLLESSKFISLRDLAVEQPDHMQQPGWFTRDLLRDTTILNYLTLSQTFFVQLSVNNLRVKKEILKNEPYPGRFLYHSKPTQVLMGGHGRILEYWPIEGKNSWILEVSDNFRRNYTASNHFPVVPEIIDGTPDITNLNRLSAGYLLDIQSS